MPPKKKDTMAPKKKDKGKPSDWLQCSLCGKLISPQDGEAHSKSCEADHGFIHEKIFRGKVVRAEGILSDDGSPITKSIRDKDSVIWLAIPTMQICRLSIGQPCIVNNVLVKRSWPIKALPLSSLAMTTNCMEELGVKEGDLVTVERFFPQRYVAHTVEILLHDPNDVFQTAEFCGFVAAYLDGKFITEGTPLCIRYFGQICHCHVSNLTYQTYTSPYDTMIQSHLSTPSKSMSASKNLQDAGTPKTPLKPASSNDDNASMPLHDISAHIGDGDASFNASAQDLSESLASLNLSSTSAEDSISTPKTSLQRTNFPNLVTPIKDTPQSISSDSVSLVSNMTFVQVSSEITKISVMSSVSESSDVEKNKRKCRFLLADVGGMASQIEELKTRIARAQQPGSASRCILLHGPAGTGKTLLVKALTSELGMPTTHVAGTDIWSKLFGEAESNLRKTFKAAQDSAPSIIVIDDIDVVCPKRSQSQAGQQEHRIVGTLLSLIDGASSIKTSSQAIVVIGVTNNKDALDPALRRAGRFGCEVEVGVPTAVQRTEILQIMLDKVTHDLSSEDISTVAKNAHGYVGADLAALMNEACMHSVSRQESSSVPTTTSPMLIMEDMVYAGLHVKPSALREIQLEVPEVRWTDIGGMSEVKMRLREAVELPLSNPDVFRRLGIEPPRGLLMYGPPGCSKTMVARALATECKLNFLAVKGPELFNQYVGESEKAIREVFRKARSAAPSIIFFDEIDAIAAKRGSSSGGSGVDDRVLTQLLTEMDGLEFLKDVFIVAATNRPDKIDRALLRPGRFDSLVYVPLPDAETRKEILEKKLRKMCVGEDVTVESLVEATHDYSGAEIIQVCQEAALHALREDINIQVVSHKHFDLALAKVQPQIDQDLMQIYKEFSTSRIK